MIRVYYKLPNPAGGWFPQVHSIPCADLAQFELRRRFPEYGVSDALVVRVEEIVLQPPTKGEEEFYARWGTAGEF